MSTVSERISDSSSESANSDRDDAFGTDSEVTYDGIPVCLLGGDIASYNTSFVDLFEHAEAGNSIFTYHRFGREIQLSMRAVTLLAEALETDPLGLSRCQCEILRIEAPDDDYIEGGDEVESVGPTLFSARCTSLAKVLDHMADHGHLREFHWMWEDHESNEGYGPVPPQVWEALSCNDGLLVMDVTPTSHSGRPYDESWVSHSHHSHLLVL